MNSKMITTSNEFSGYDIEEYLGLCRGVMVRSRSIVGNIGASLHTIVGGNIKIYSDLCEQTRQETLDLMIKHADSLGANAIIAVRYESNELGQGLAEILCYGTAVRISKK